MCYYLTYFIEGTNAIHYINLAKAKTIFETKEVIHNHWSDSLFKGVGPGELKLLKVCLLPL